MKFKLLILLGFIVATSTFSQSICPPPTELGSTIDVWDWTAQTYTIYYTDAVGNAQVANFVESPFWDLDNSEPINVAHLQVANPPDNSPQDAWELLSYNLGSPTKFSAAPSFALYNRYTGTVRSFFYIPTNNAAPFNLAQVTAQHKTSFEHTEGSALFSFMRSPFDALDAFDPTGNRSTSVNIYVPGGVWMLNEFVTAYDPCVCLYDSKIFFEPTLRDTSTMSFSLGGTGNTIPIVQNGTSGSALNRGFDIATNGLGALGAGLTSFNSLNSYYNTVNAIDTDGEFAFPREHSLTVLGNLLPSWIGAGTSIVRLLRFFTGGGRSPSASRVSGYSSTFSFQGNINMNNQQLQSPSSIWTPNSASQNDPNTQDGSDPVYGNNLGVFNLLRTPKLKVRTNLTPESLGRGYDVYFNLAPIQFLVNTSAGFNATPSRIMYSLVFEDCTGDLNRMGLLSQEGGGLIRTPLVDAQCFEDQVVNFFGEFRRPVGVDSNTSNPTTPGGGGVLIDIGGGTMTPPPGGSTVSVTSWTENSCSFDNVTVQVLAILSPENGDEEVVFMGSFKVELEFSNEQIQVGEDNYRRVFTGFSNDLSAANNCVRSRLPIVRPGELSNFCENEYNARPSSLEFPSVNVSEVGPELFRNVQEEISVFPNPVISSFTIEANSPFSGLLNLYDLNGKKVLEKQLPKSFEATKHQLNASSLPSGIYHGQVQTTEGLKHFKIIKK